MKAVYWTRMNEYGGKNFCLEKHLSRKSPCLNYFQFWQPRGCLFRVQPPGTEIKWGEISNWGAFIFPNPLSRQCRFLSSAQPSCLWNGFAGHLVWIRLQALKVSSSYSFQARLGSRALALWVGQVDTFSLHYFFWVKLFHTFLGNSRLGLGRPFLCTCSQRVQAVKEWPGCKLLDITNQFLTLQTLQVFCSAVISISEFLLECFANRKQDPLNNLFSVFCNPSK